MAKNKGSKKTAKKPVKPASAQADNKERRTRRTKPYPSIPFDDALTLGKAIVEYGGGLPIKRLTLMEKMNRSPTSGPTRAMITDSGKYGITEGSYNADTLKLTENGKIVCAGEASESERVKAAFQLSIDGIEPFKAMYDQYVNNRLPSKEAIKDFLEESKLEVHQEDLVECIDLFIVNCKSVGLLRTIAGSETLVPIDTLLASLPTQVTVKVASRLSETHDATGSPVKTSSVDWSKVCFYISPIGDEESDERMHADLFLGSLVRPAVEEVGLSVFRADEIDHAGMITGVVMEWIDRAKLVVADLSMLNPNVFYELALRHVKRKPLVCLIRKSDRIPFDINQLGVVVIDNANLYSFVPQIDTYRSQFASKARRAIEDPEAVGNPLFSFYPSFWNDLSK
ncbi:MAG: hypothetical protein R3B46_07845 [Phycisphaerales bacterium]